KANGERIIKKSELGETQYISANYIVRNKTVISKHVFAGNQRIASTVSMKNNCGTMTEQNTMYFHPDHLGSSSYVTDKKGNFFEMIEYLPYGETLYDEAATVDKTEFRFTSKEQDAETGLYYYGARYRDSKTGVWLSVDPALSLYLAGKGSEGGVYNPSNLNLYSYCGNDPINYIDPDGRLKVFIWRFTGSLSGQNWGHASMMLDNGEYISWWPNTDTKDTIIEYNLLIKSIYTAKAYEKRTYKQDEEEEKHSPDFVIDIQGLDEDAILKWWNDFKTNNYWKTFSQNCSTTIADGLAAGGGDKYSSFMASWNIIWKPNDVEDYAKSIKAGLDLKKAESLKPKEHKPSEISAGHEERKTIDKTEDIYRDDPL
ncbi:MAG TPA: RHS repeat-associated core domain-containing protein, partial [Bacilli bacterium]|nr:RHS repeat-associated core domain-containing protein [Bacilli bacterium]